MSHTPTSLLAGAQADDAAAWERLVHTYSRSIYRWCRQAGLQPADAGNVAQEVFRAVARKLSDFRRSAEGDTFRGWLHKITQNKVHDHYRNCAKRRDQAVGGTDAHQRLLRLQSQPAPTPGSPDAGSREFLCDQAADPDERRRREAVAQVRAECSERDWRFFWRVIVDGQSAVDVGTEFGVSANTVRLVKMRILRRLREILGDEQSPGV